MFKKAILLLSILICYSCSNSNTMNKLSTPIAKKDPQILSIHGDERIDNYFWMRLSDEQKEAKEPDLQTKQVLDYLHTENEYLKSKMSHTNELQNKLFNEIKDRIKKDDSCI